MKTIALGLTASLATLLAAAAPGKIAKPPQVTFSKDVAPILVKNCQGCHRPGETAPMSLLTYQEARPWAKAIREAVVLKRMPPWYADSHFGKFSNDRSLSQSEIDTLVAWADNGALEGDPKQTPKPAQFVDGWNIGTPDLVLEMTKEYQVPAAGTIKYEYFTIPTQFTEDKWVRMAEVRPGNRALVLLVIWELTDSHPVIDLAVFKSRNWLLSTLTLSLMFAIFFGNIVLTPMWLHVQLGYTATWAGYATAPMGILAVLTAPIVGRLLPRVDPRWIVTFGFGVLALSFFMRAHMTSSVDYMTVAIAMLVLGAGIPACIITLTSLGVSDLPPEKVASGAGLQNFIRIMSMAIGASITQTYWEHMTRHSRAELVAAIDPTIAQELATKAGAIGFSPERSQSLFSGLVDGQAVMLATNDFYAGATLLMLGLIPLIWVIRRPKAPLKAVAH